MTRRRAHRGFVLVMALALVALAAVVMVGLSRAAMARIGESRRVQDDLQFRWGLASCRTALLPDAEKLLTLAEAKEREPVAVLRATVPLGKMKFHVAVGDEQAKANVNMLVKDNTRSRAEKHLRDALSGTGLGHRIDLRFDPKEQNPWPIGSFGQVFDGKTSPEDWSKLRLGRAPMDRITCWGNGTLNLRRADEDAVYLLTQRVLTKGQVQNLMEKVQESERLDVQGLLAGLQLDEEQRKLIEPMLGEASMCHSVWITAEGENRKRHYLTIMDETDEEKPRYYASEW